jgi:hypothetical protein
MIEIESSKLTLDFIPSPEAGYEEIYDFAQTFDGYKRCGSIQNLEQIFRKKGHKTLDELRASLFYYQRVWHGQEEIPKGEYLEIFKSLVQAIRERVAQGENKGLSMNEDKPRKIMTAYDSRAIARDINQPPFTDLPFEDKMSIRNMFGEEIVTFDEYLIERNKLIRKWGGQNVTEFPIHTPGKEEKPFSNQIKEFIQSVTWTYAKTMPDWPHEYIVRHHVDKELFIEMVKHIREFGYQGRFYEKSITYFDEAGKVYWTMGEPIEKTIVINRCREEDTFESRKKSGTLPDAEEK